jgi:hypothetical protein
MLISIDILQGLDGDELVRRHVRLLQEWKEIVHSARTENPILCYFTIRYIDVHAVMLTTYVYLFSLFFSAFVSLLTRGRQILLIREALLSAQHSHLLHIARLVDATVTTATIETARSKVHSYFFFVLRCNV